MGQVGLNNLTFREVAANGKSVQEMWLNGSQIYAAGDLWYGVRFTGSSPDGVRTGNMQMHKDLPVQSLFKGCRLTSDGTIKYFNATDWDHYEDGSEVTNSIEDGNDMVELPDAYYTVVVHGDYDWEIRMSLYPLEGYTKFSKKYCSAYEAYRDGSTLYSIRNQVPTVNTNRATFLTQARNGRSNSYAIYTYEIHKFITWCYVVEYATLNSQKAVNTALTEEGYHKVDLVMVLLMELRKKTVLIDWLLYLQVLLIHQVMVLVKYSIHTLIQMQKVLKHKPVNTLIDIEVLRIHLVIYGRTVVILL